VRPPLAVLEYDLLGIAPSPGSAAAAVIALRRIGPCTEHQPVDVGTLADEPDTVMLCTRCGDHLMPGEDGGWQDATS
jgi:hypothetical protein